MVNDSSRQFVIDRFHGPLFKGQLGPEMMRVHMSNPLCGDAVDYGLQVIDGKITEVAWQGDGCAISQASADILAEKLIGLTLAEAKAVVPETVIGWLQIEIRPAREKCALLPLEALTSLLE